jgi:hypothetical protein
MHEVVRMPDPKLEELFLLTAEQMAMPPGIVEKDFWVVWMLDYLFARSPWKTQLAFKGGTSLSKAFGLIKRFSEDIDLILDWRLLGYGLREPWEERSNTQQDLFNEAANARSAAFLKNVFVPRIKGVFTRSRPNGRFGRRRRFSIARPCARPSAAFRRGAIRGIITICGVSANRA